MKKNELGAFGESLVAKKCHCPRCKRVNSLKNLPNNFKCADVICDFCGFVAQVKSIHTKLTDKIPRSVLGAAWGP
jgi:type II restriction enzyme